MAVAFFDLEGGYDFNNGTAFRRARIGFEASPSRNSTIASRWISRQCGESDRRLLQYLINLRYLVRYRRQHKRRFGLESNNSDNYNTFMDAPCSQRLRQCGRERRDRRLGELFQGSFRASDGLFGDNESISRSNMPPPQPTHAPDESWGVNGRVTWEPIYDTGKILHFGVSGFYRTSLKSGDTQDRASERRPPNTASMAQTPIRA